MFCCASCLCSYVKAKDWNKPVEEPLCAVCASGSKLADVDQERVHELILTLHVCFSWLVAESAGAEAPPDRKAICDKKKSALPGVGLQAEECYKEAKTAADNCGFCE